MTFFKSILDNFQDQSSVSKLKYEIKFFFGSFVMKLLLVNFCIMENFSKYSSFFKNYYSNYSKKIIENTLNKF